MIAVAPVVVALVIESAAVPVPVAESVRVTTPDTVVVDPLTVPNEVVSATAVPSATVLPYISPMVIVSVVIPGASIGEAGLATIAAESAPATSANVP